MIDACTSLMIGIGVIALIKLHNFRCKNNGKCAAFVDFCGKFLNTKDLESLQVAVFVQHTV